MNINEQNQQATNNQDLYNFNYQQDNNYDENQQEINYLQSKQQFKQYFQIQNKHSYFQESDDEDNQDFIQDNILFGIDDQYDQNNQINMIIQNHSNFYYNQLTAQQKQIYDYIFQQIITEHSVIFQVPQDLLPVKICHAINMDYITNVYGKVKQKQGQFTIKRTNNEQIFSDVLKNRSQIFISNKIQDLAIQYSQTTNSNFLQSLIDKMISTISISEQKDADTVLHVFQQQRANSLGIARAFALCCNLNRIESGIIGCKYMDKEHYFNYLIIPLDQYPTFGSLCNNNILKRNNNIYTCIDITATIMCKTQQYISQDFIYNSLDRLSYTHQIIGYFQYKYQFQTLHKIENQIVSFESIRLLIQQINEELQKKINKRKRNQQYIYYELYFDNQVAKQSSMDFIQANSSYFPAIMLRFMPQYQFDTLQDTLTSSLSFTLIFKEIPNTQEQKPFLFKDKIEQFDDQTYEQISSVINKNENNLFIINFDEKQDFQKFIDTFNEKQLFNQIDFQNKDGIRIGMITKFLEASHNMAVIMTYLNKYNGIKNKYRINKNLLDQNLLNVYTQIVQQLIEKRNDVIEIKNIELLNSTQVQYVLNQIQLDFPELFWLQQNEEFDLNQQRNQDIYQLLINKTQLQFSQIQKMQIQLDNVLQILKLPTQGTELQKQQRILKIMEKYYFNNDDLTYNESASSVYDFLVQKQINSLTVNLAYAFLCQKCGIVSLVISSITHKHYGLLNSMLESESDDNNKVYYININYINEKESISDLMQLYLEKIKLQNNKSFYIQSAINIDQKLFSTFQTSNCQFDINRIQNVTHTFNKIYTKYFVTTKKDGYSEMQIVKQINQIAYQQYQERINECIIQFSYRNIDQQQILQIVKDNILNIQNSLINKYQPIILGKYEIYNSKTYPIIIIKFQDNKLSTEELHLKIDNFQQKTIQILLQQAQQQISSNKYQWFVKLSQKIQPIIYQTQFDKNQVKQIFDEYFENEMIRRKCKLVTILSANEYVLSWYIEKL